MNDRTFVTGRGSVNMAECDQWGHMNVQFYLARATDAQAHLAARIGLAPSRLRKEALSLRPLADRTLFKRELRGGDIHMIRSGIRAVHPEGTIDIASRMTNLVTGVESAAFDTRLALMGPDDATRPLPDDVRSAALDLSGDLPEMPAPPPRAAVQPLGAPPLDRMLLTYRGSIEPWDCDTDGVAPPRAHIARFNDAITHLFRAMALDRRALLAEGTRLRHRLSPPAARGHRRGSAQRRAGSRREGLSHHPPRRGFQRGFHLHEHRGRRALLRLAAAQVGVHACVDTYCRRKVDRSCLSQCLVPPARSKGFA